MTVRNAAVHEISIMDDSFESFRKDFDKIINQAVNNMREQNLDTAEMTCKVTVETSERMVENPSENNLNEKRKAIVPTYKHKITCVIKHETKADGAFAGNFELVWDEDEGRWVMVEMGSPQTSMFDHDSPYMNPDDSPIPADGSVQDAADGYLPPPSTYLPEAEDEDSGEAAADDDEAAY